MMETERGNGALVRRKAIKKNNKSQDITNTNANAGNMESQRTEGMPFV
jgi:hypothetical protein